MRQSGKAGHGWRDLPSEEARFSPGEIFASRYRIIRLLGRGAMGEAYHVDDLKFGQLGARDALFRGARNEASPQTAE
jgi:serine/threonine protein kinase